MALIPLRFSALLLWWLGNANAKTGNILRIKKSTRSAAASNCFQGRHVAAHPLNCPKAPWCGHRRGDKFYTWAARGVRAHSTVQKMNLLLTIVFGVVGLALSYGFFIPPELSIFRLIAAIGIMVGYQIGRLIGRLVRPSPKRFLALSVGAVLCFYFVFGYASMIQMGSANTDIVNLGALFGLFFLSLGFSLSFVRFFVPNQIEILWSKAIGYFARLFRG